VTAQLKEIEDGITKAILDTTMMRLTQDSLTNERLMKRLRDHLVKIRELVRNYK